MPVPCPTDQLFHTCVHGLQWDWVPHIRWVADALTVLRNPIDWPRLTRLTAAASMSHRLAQALQYLRDVFGSPIPANVPRELRLAAQPWEIKEYELLIKPCPLGFADSVRWHACHYRRIRDGEHHDSPLRRLMGWPGYLATFLNARGPAEFVRGMATEIRARLRSHR